MKEIVIFPGRFQPMLGHHASVYQKLINDHPDKEVYITTSDKVESGKSPFNFKEKQLIAQAHGIDATKILQVKRNYNAEDLAPYINDAENTAVYFAVGQKDMEDNPRFVFDNMDKETGLSIKPNGDPYYFQKINSIKKEPKPMLERGYILVIENEKDDIENGILSASAFRQAIVKSPNKEAAKEVFNKYFKNYNEPVFELVYKKIVGDKMNEDLNILRQLAGLDVQEAAPVEFDNPLKPGSVKFTKGEDIAKSSSMYSIANRFPKDKEIDNPEDKKDVFVNALLKSPASLLSEINERIMGDENGLEVSKKLSEIIDGMRDGGMAELDKEDRAFTLEIVKNAINNMTLIAGDDREFDPEDQAIKDSVDLSNIRSDYGVEEGVKTGKHGYLVYDDGKPLSFSDWKHENDKEGGDGGKKQYKKYLKLVDEDVMSEGGNAFDLAMTDAEAGIMDCKDDDECLEMLNAMKYNNPDDADEMMADDVIESYIEMIEKFGLEKIKAKIDSEMNQPEPQEESTEISELDDTNMADQTSAKLTKLNKELGGSGSSSERIKGALDVGDKAGNIRPIDQEIIKPYIAKLKMFTFTGMEKYLEDLKNLMDRAESAYTKLGGQDMQMAGESFDHNAEQSREDEAYDELMDAYQKGGEEGLCKAIGCTERELSDEIEEICREKDLHADDDRDECIQLYVEELVDNADWKDHGGMDSDPADLDVEEAVSDTSNKALKTAMEELKKLAGLDPLEEEDETKMTKSELEAAMKCLAAGDEEGTKRHLLNACATCGCR